MEIRNSTEKDFGQIMKLYEYARKFMAEHGNPNQWGRMQWPPKVLIYQDIAQKNSYVCIHKGRIVGTFCFWQGKDIEPTYRQIVNGNWLDDSAYGVIHRLAGDGSTKGIGKFCLNWAYQQCGHLRVDTHRDNVPMQNLLESMGFVHCGTIFVEQDNTPRLAYEKISL